MRETITFRPRRSKRQLREAFGNISEKLNELIERELSQRPPPDWRVILDRRVAKADPKAYEICLKPE